ncbi:MAG: uncharacterized protein PWR13_919 [Archaeoglobi archaeon]|nr:uncharacterized protein [Archaeoglobi archaeon]
MRKRVKIRETVATLELEERFIEEAERIIKMLRGELEAYILRDPIFYVTLEPHEPLEDAPEIVRRMCEAGELFNVGPMASVAGAISQMTMERLAELGCRDGFIENGGDIAMINERRRKIEVYHGRGNFRIILEFPSSDEIIGICTSSASIGHSISFGVANAATVIAEDAIIADAGATALCNQATPENFEDVLREITSVRGVLGALVVFDDFFSACGELPEIKVFRRCSDSGV